MAKVAHFLKLTGEGMENLRVAVAILFNRPRMIQNNLVFVVNEDQVYDSSYAIAMSSIVCTQVSCVVETHVPRISEVQGTHPGMTRMMGGRCYW